LVKPLTHAFTPDILRTFDKKKVETIRENALRLGADELAQMCELDLAERKPAIGASRSSSGTSRAPARSAARIGSASSPSRTNMVVSGFHFVCEKDHGVIDLGDGRFWTGSWTVPEANVDQSLSAGAYLALHLSKTQPSYRQGKIVGYRRAPDEGENALDFLVDAAPKSRAWVGAGSGDTGLKWAKVRDED
jgi:hypothetical protein